MTDKTAEQEKVLKVFMAEFNEKFGHPVDIYGLVKLIEHNLVEKEAELVSTRFKTQSHGNLLVMRGIVRDMWKTQALKDLDEMIDAYRIGGADKLMHELRGEDLISADEMTAIARKISTKEAEIKTKANNQQAEALKVKAPTVAGPGDENTIGIEVTPRVKKKVAKRPSKTV